MECVLNAMSPRKETLNFYVKKDKRYAVPKSLIPKYENYERFNKYNLKGSNLVLLDIVERSIIAHIFRLKLFNDYGQAREYAEKKGHNTVYDLRSDSCKAL